MFLLILSTSTISGCFLHFNTSHVSINLKPYPWHHSTVFISIHLMFLLIQRWELYRHSKGGYFNTSHVSINHTGSIATTCVVRDFNTSHVSINLTLSCFAFFHAFISIHLMFLLIAGEVQPSPRSYPYFNTSHVSINRVRIPGGSSHRGDFNTSHVSINHFDPCTEQRPVAISIHLMFLLILAS